MKVKYTSSFQSKSLDVVPSILTTRKSWTNWKSTALLRSVRELRLQGKPLPQTLERQKSTENHSAPGTETTSGARKQRFKGICKCWRPSLWASVKSKKSWDPPKGGPATFMSFTFRRLIRFSGWRSEKITLELPTERWEKQTFWNIPGALYSALFCSALPALRRNYFTRAQLAWGEGNTQFQPPPAFVFNLIEEREMGRKRWDVLVKVTARGPGAH